MALGTPNTQAIAIANQEIDIAQQLVAIMAIIDHAASQFVQLTLGTTFGAMGTLTVRPDGTIGDPDTTPNPDHPLDPGLYPEITRLVTANDIGSLNTLLQEVSKMLKGQPVSQQGQAPQLLARLVGGEGDGVV